MSKTFNKNISFVYNTGANLRLSSNTNTIGNLFTTGGSVGIGTSAPGSTLDVLSASTGQFPIISRFLAPNATGGSAQAPRLVIGVDTTDSVSLSYYKAGTTSANNYIGFGHTNVGDGQIVLTRAGNVGIGTGNPSVSLQVNGHIFGKPSSCMYYLNYPSNGANTYYVQYPNGYNIPFNQNFYEGVVVTKQANTTEFRLNYAGYYLINLQTNIISVTTTEQHYAVSANISSGVMTRINTAQYGYCPASQRLVPGLFTYMINVTTPGNIFFVITPNSLLNNVIQGLAYSTDTMHAVQFHYLGQG